MKTRLFFCVPGSDGCNDRAAVERCWRRIRQPAAYRNAVEPRLLVGPDQCEACSQLSHKQPRYV